MINKIYYIIKKCYKIIFIIGFVIMVLAKLSGGVFASTNYYDNDANYSQDPTVLIKQYYDNLCYNTIRYLVNKHNTTEAQWLADNILRRNNIYVTKGPSDYSSYIYVFWQDSPTQFINTHTGDFDYVSIPVVSGQLGYNDRITAGYIQGQGWVCIHDTYYNPSGYLYVPTCLIGYMNESLFNWARWEKGQADADTIASLLTVIADNTGDMSEKMDEMIEEQKETNDFMKDEDTSGVNTDFSNPSGSTSDSTASAFDGIFMRFYNSMTSNSSGVAIDVPIPFTNKNISIPSNLTRNILSQYMGQLFNDLLPLVWYFLVGLYILKDMAKIIQDIKSGDIMTKTDTNIKTDML